MSAGRPAGRFVLETERLLLREMGQSDLAALCAILQDDETMYAYEGALSDDEAQAWLDRQMERYARDGFGLWAVVLKETGAMMGECGLTEQDGDGVRVVSGGVSRLCVRPGGRRYSVFHYSRHEHPLSKGGAPQRYEAGGFVCEALS